MKKKGIPSLFITIILHDFCVFIIMLDYAWCNLSFLQTKRNHNKTQYKIK